MEVSRTCTEIREENGKQSQGVDSKPLEVFRSVPAYVLLGDPGAGKSTAFKMECEALGDEAYHRPVSADEFLEYDANDFPSEWRGKTLFIDGLDEVRAGSQDVSAQFREVRKRLRTLGTSRFRLSCRHADWRGRIDQDKLRTVSQDTGLVILQLDPLTTCDVEKILGARSDIPDVSAFIASAQKRGIDELFKNPQTLKLLADVVGAGGAWPASRKELFEKACLLLVQEQNEEHQAAKELTNPLESADLLNAAGRLCVLQLISGTYGYTRLGHPDEKHPTLDQCDYDLVALRSALDTMLFKGIANNRFVPVHRHIAEFLAGRCLASFITGGLPACHVIALITEEGMVVTEMRGLSAWLAVHNEDARAYLIEQDPVGVGLYGDIGGFSTEEKRAFLVALNREVSRPGSYVWKWDTAFLALATPELESDIKEVLTSPCREEKHQRFVGFVLSVLRENDSLPDISGILLEMVRDDTWWSDVNLFALDAFIRNCPDDDNKTRQLKALLTDIQSGDVSDPDNELLGTLLIHLYPRNLSSLEVWKYLFAAGDRSFFGRHYRFWTSHFIKESSDEQVGELLDSLSAWIPVWHTNLNSSRLTDLAAPLSCEDFLSMYLPRSLQRLPANLLIRGLEAHGDRINAKHLYDWLDLGFVGSVGLGGSNQGGLREIRLWLEQRPEVQKTMLMEGLRRCSASDSDKGFRTCAFRIRKRLYGASPPSDYGLWCLEEAVALVDSKPRIAVRLLEIAAGTLESQNGNEGLPLDLLIERAGSVKLLDERLKQILAPCPIPPEILEYQEQDKQYAEEQRRHEEEWLAYVQSNETALRENRAIPYLLNQIAWAYFSNDDSVFLGFSREGGPKAIRQWLQGNEVLTNAALQGLRGVMNREDVPGIEEILDLHNKGPRHDLAWPFLASLAEVERTAPGEDASQWDEDRIRKAVAFYYCTPHADYYPQWYRQLLTGCPDLVAEVKIQFAIGAFRSGSDYIYELYELAHHPDHAQVAKYASLPLLQAFPVRCTLKQVKHLNYLLWAAIQHADRTSLQQLIARKRFLKSMNVAQRISWLAAGVIIAPEAFGGALKDFVQGRERRVRSLWQFIYSGSEAQFTFRNLDISTSEFFIHLLGSYFAPYRPPMGSRTITPEEEASNFVGSLIRQFDNSTEEEASDVLTNLLADPALEQWHDALSQTQDTQQTIRRDANYRHPDIEQVCKTLKGHTPANPAGLAALIMGHLHGLGMQIRTGNTDDWYQYWNEGKEKHSDFPRHENLCRNALLSDLKKCLPQGVDAKREGSYANNKRADICVSYTHPSAGYFQVPVEIKKNENPYVWSAWENQLKQYTDDPDSGGHGIYLVFWFGEQYTKAPPRGTLPVTNAKEMRERLEELLLSKGARKISVCVIDVSQPDGK